MPNQGNNNSSIGVNSKSTLKEVTQKCLEEGIMVEDNMTKGALMIVLRKKLKEKACDGGE